MKLAEAAIRLHRANGGHGLTIPFLVGLYWYYNQKKNPVDLLDYVLKTLREDKYKKFHCTRLDEDVFAHPTCPYHPAITAETKIIKRIAEVRQKKFSYHVRGVAGFEYMKSKISDREFWREAKKYAEQNGGVDDLHPLRTEGEKK